MSYNDNGNKRYLGYYNNGKRDVIGVQYDKNGKKEYAGEITNDRANGYGIRYFNGKKDEGYFKEGAIKNEVGIRYYKNGKYEGSLFGLERNGFGLRIYANGSMYIGSWEKDKLNGLCATYSERRGVFSVGPFENDKMEGLFVQNCCGSNIVKIVEYKDDVRVKTIKSLLDISEMGIKKDNFEDITMASFSDFNYYCEDVLKDRLFSQIDFILSVLFSDKLVNPSLDEGVFI